VTIGYTDVYADEYGQDDVYVLPRPDVIFEAQFFTDDDDNPVWTDLSDRVELSEGISVAQRKNTVFDKPSARSLSLTLDNSDGALVNGNAGSPFYGKVALDTDLRLRFRWPRINTDTVNMLSDAQSLASDAGQFTAEQGIVTTDDSAEALWVDDEDSSIAFTGTWVSIPDSGYYNESSHGSKTAASVASYSFTGTSIAWIGAKSSNRGIASIAIDGVSAGTVDAYSVPSLYQQVLFSRTGLTPGDHTITVTASGTKNASASDCWIDVDAFIVSAAATPPDGQESDLVWETGVLSTAGVRLISGGNSVSRVPDSDNPVYVKAGRVYTGQLQAKADPRATGLGFQASARLLFYPIDGATPTEVTGTPVTLTGAYQALTVTGTAPADGTVRLALASETTVGPTTAAISFVGSYVHPMGYPWNPVYISSTAKAGDVALVWQRISDKSLAITAPSGWTAVGTWTDNTSKTVLYKRVLQASDRNKRFDWKTPKKTKWIGPMVIYTGVDQANPIHKSSMLVEGTYRTAHSTPNVTTTIPGCLIVSAAFDTATATTSWGAPAGENVRSAGYCTGSQAPTGVVSDDGASNPAGTYGLKAFTANVASKSATTHTVALAPAAGTGPGSVTIQAGAWQISEGTGSPWQQGGHWDSQFTGLADSWERTTSGDLSVVAVSATDRSKQLATVTVGSALSEDILAQDPVAYYRLDEPDTGTASQQEAANSALVTQPTLKQVQYGTGGALQWGQGTGPGVDGASALVMAPSSLSNGLGLLGTLGNPVTAVTSASLIVWFNSTRANDGQQVTIFKVADAMATSTNLCFIELKGFSGTNLVATSQVKSDASSYLVNATKNGNFFDGKTHMVAGTYELSGGQLIVTLYIDGVQQATTTMATPVAQFSTMSTVGLGHALSSPALYPGTLSNAALFGYALDADTIGDIYTAGTTAFAGDTITDRLSRIADWEGLSGLDLDSTTTVVDRHMPDERNLLEALDQVADSEGGIVYVNGDGDIKFISRTDRETTSVPLITVNTGLCQPRQITDDQLLVNKAVITRLATTVKTTLVDQESVDAHGAHEHPVDTILRNDDDARNYATYLLSGYSNPPERCQPVKFNALLLQDWPAVNGIDVWKVLEVQELPAVETTSDADYYIEGWALNISEDEWGVECDVSSAIPYGVVNDPDRSLVGIARVGW
jgi:hypothetical protein